MVKVGEGHSVTGGKLGRRSHGRGRKKVKRGTGGRLSRLAGSRCGERGGRGGTGGWKRSCCCC